jgi:hypothetical protein
MPLSAAQHSAPALNLPPGFTLATLRESGDAHRHACGIAAEAGGGTFVWVRRFDVLEFAVVLEPEEPLASARRAVFAGMAAMADALSAYAPPEKAVTFTWPTILHFDGGRLGGGRLAWPEGCGEDRVPDWLVFSGMILAAPVGLVSPGAHLGVTWLEEEGFDTAEASLIVESFARHLMLAFHSWSERGFKAVADTYLARLPRDAEATRRGIDANGDLLVHGSEGLERTPLLAPLEEAPWYDPATGLPRV